MITPDPSQDFSVLNAFTNRLQAETDPNTLWIVDVPDVDLILFWEQALNSTQVAEYSKDPAVSGTFEMSMHSNQFLGY
jgi:hypothetical protein